MSDAFSSRAFVLSVTCALALCASPKPAAAAAQDGDQQKCINAIYKSAAKVVDAVGKGAVACVSDTARGDLPAGLTGQECLGADDGGGIAKAYGSMISSAEKSCSTAPTIGPALVAVAAGAVSRNVLPIAQTYGFPLDTSIVTSTDRAGSGCQSAVIGNIGKLTKSKLKEFNRCVSFGMRDSTITSEATLGACTASFDTGKVPKALQKAKDIIGLRCVGQTVADLFPGDCAAQPVANLASCVNDRLDCSLCLAMVAAGGMTANCDMVDNGIADDSCHNGPTFPATPAAYETGPASYVSALTVPTVTAGVATCCRDFGPISRDSIEHGTDHIDNALAALGDTLALLGVNLQDLLTETITSGDVALLLDHQGLDTLNVPDLFALAALNGTFEGATDYAAAAAGTGTFTVDTGSFVPGTGTPLSVFYPGSFEAGAGGMSAGPSSLLFPIPLGLVLLDLPVNDVFLSGDPTVSPAGVTYANGKLSGYLLVDSFFEGLNTLLDSPACDCLGAASSIYSKNIAGHWAGACIAHPDGCTAPSEAICATLAGSSLPNVCSLLPGIISNAADIDLDGDHSVYEGFSVGFGFTGAPADIVGLTP